MEATKLLEAEIERIAKDLSSKEYLSADYGAMVDRVKTLAEAAESLAFVQATSCHPVVEVVDAPEIEGQLSIYESAKPEFEEPTSTSVFDTEKAAYTQDEVRASLQAAAQRGVKIEPIVKQFTPEGKPVKFSSIPESAYAELMEVLNDAG